MQPSPIKIICPTVHESVQSILNQVQVLRKRPIFAKLLDHYIKNSIQGAFEEVVTMYEKALEQYNVIHTKLDNGEWNRLNDELQ